MNNYLESIPFWEKYALTVNEAAAYFHIGDKKLREIIADDPEADYLLKVGSRQMIKRKRFEQFIDRQSAL
ncbi:MAG: excisionase [Eubacteriales bacterium]|nr:excisionase [Eubacteriales bacterium]